MVGAAHALTASALRGALENNLTMTGFDFGDDLAEPTLDKLLPYKLLFPSRRAQCPSLLFELPYLSRLYEIQG